MQNCSDEWDNSKVPKQRQTTSLFKVSLLGQGAILRKFKSSIHSVTKIIQKQQQNTSSCYFTTTDESLCSSSRYFIYLEFREEQLGTIEK